MNESKITELTPIEKYDGVYFKRDDLYKPFSDLPELSGSKVRQMQMLLDYMFKNELWNYKGIISFSSVNSPQAVIVARIAHEYRLPCIIGVGVSEDELKKSIDQHPTLSLAEKYNAEIISLASIGYNSVLKKRSSDIAQKLNYFLIDFGINVEKNTYGVIRGIASQVQNLPNNIDNLIIPCGSGLSMAGIIVGLKLFDKKVKRIIGIQISGIDRKTTINKILSIFNIAPEYEFIIDKTYKYQTHVEITIKDQFELSKVYEAKAFEYFKKHQEELKIADSDKNLFWCIGCNNFLFDKKETKNIEQSIKVTISDFKKLVNPCTSDMINNHCLAECCKDSYLKLGHPAIIILKEEQYKILALNNEYKFRIDEGSHLLKPENHVCPFQEQQSNYCKLHNTDKKPFGCNIMPIELSGNTMKVQKYFPKMKCQNIDFPNVTRVPFYIGFKQSLVAVFGESETERIVKEIETGKEDISVNITDSQINKMKEVKKNIRNLSKISKHNSDTNYNNSN